MSGGCERCTGHPVGAHLKTCGCPCAPEGCRHAASLAIQDRVTEAQRRLREKHGIIVIPRCRAHFRAIARWNELEAERRYAYMPDDDGLQSWERDLRAARNYRWLVEIMDAGHRVAADAHGVYVEGMLASEYAKRAERKAKRNAG